MSWAPNGITSTPNDAAALWSAPNWPSPERFVKSRRTATRVTLGATCLRRSNHFPLMPSYSEFIKPVYSEFINPVMLPPGWAKLSTKPPATGSATDTNTIGMLRVALPQHYQRRSTRAKNHVRRERNDFCRVPADVLRFSCGPTHVELNIATNAPTRLLQPLEETGEPGCHCGSSAGG